MTEAAMPGITHSMIGDPPTGNGREPALVHLVKWAEMAVRNRVETALRPMALTTVQLLLLVMLDEVGEATPAALSRAMHRTPQAMTTLLKPLERDGLVARRPDETNRRRILLSLDTEGRKLLRRVRSVTPEVEAELFAELDDTERATLRRLLMKIAQPLG
ncbi:MarR family winged helix-turn-helix transcriptional regulator [Parasphingopyxis marina]|uniref:MarR family transcriptional regulator n=1 Tax=Parasphingopyxis marina TaxID=2761622 RepID=A0A842HW48_9SPHN|nr:MarR family transcriptional regulator [Parasphingopyxis marina]MBC2777336.1 MarR family transcriptional regulator [Parasphingopyxis marina]